MRRKVKVQDKNGVKEGYVELPNKQHLRIQQSCKGCVLTNAKRYKRNDKHRKSWNEKID